MVDIEQQFFVDNVIKRWYYEDEFHTTTLISVERNQVVESLIFDDK